MAERTNVPEIRFAGFTDPWEQRKFSEIVDVCSGRDYKHLNEGPIPVYGTGGYMTSVCEALSHNRDAVGIGRKGTIDKPYLLKAPFWTVDTLFYAIPKPDINLEFALCSFLNVDWKSKDESTGLPSLSKEAINETVLRVPNAVEQNHLGSFFTDLDSLITLHQRKHDKLVQLKKSMLDKMFPKPGETEPEIRFAGFTDPWEQRKLGDVATIVGGGTPSTNNDAYWDGDIDWYSPAELGEQVYADRSVRRITQAGYDSCSATLLPAGKTILFTSRAGIGNAAILRRSACTNQGFQSLVVNDDTDVYFVYSMTDRIKKFAEQNASGSTFLEISGKGLAAGEFAFPSKDEQTAIGSMFKQLDHLITLHQRKLGLLRNTKKSLLDRMFV
ncbi:restriction endonuclease subunit S [Slackia isoflavoniconvertens]|uniref:restriction endonuclease subunit S n=1 Tax=Slackia isoflavoniconvertens TaxID=572010 RepID=UPI003078E205